jgi:hypothetical protein
MRTGLRRPHRYSTWFGANRPHGRSVHFVFLGSCVFYRHRAMEARFSA